jgi:threonine synthase
MLPARPRVRSGWRRGDGGLHDRRCGGRSASVVRYISTRGRAPALGFEDVVLAGLARDGGLYVPERWPALAPQAFGQLAGLDYARLAARILAPFAQPAIGEDDLLALASDAHRGFDHPDIAPLRLLEDGLWLLELFHGPTLAFKDFALQLLGRLFDLVLGRRGERVTIVGATSGDTGSAAIDACRDRDAIEIFILHPKGRVSEVQRRQMTTVASANVHNIAIEGTFDDCQDLVKAMFNDRSFRDRHHLSAVNSINWARIAAQIVYYVFAALRLGAPGRPVAFAVPTGNFGNVFAAYAAGRMGLPIARLIIGSNRNDILTRFFASGRMEIEEVIATLSPSMDIQVSSNFERYLFELYDRDPSVVAALMERFRCEGRVAVEPERLARARADFAAWRFDDDATRTVIGDVWRSHGVLTDPHSAIAVAAARAWRAEGHAAPVVAVATAHPAKFPEAIAAATGVTPALPERLAAMFDRPERYRTLPADLAAVERAIAATLAEREASS